MEINIGSLWNGQKLDHDPMKMIVRPVNGDGFIKVKVSGKFFNDPPAPTSPPGPTDKLWDYEVVEAFFLNSKDNTYLEVEFSPHGHYIVLLLQGKRNIIDSLLPFKYEASISDDKQTWKCESEIPVDYFPPSVDKFNAFAIHGSEPQRQYEQLFPQKPPITQPDFHRLEDFGDLDFDSILPTNRTREYSAVWKAKMKS